MYKKTVPLLVLIFILAISVSAVSAYDGDNSTVSAADENIEILDTNVDDGSLEMVNDYDQLSYPSSSSDSWIKFDEDDITINEGDSYTIHGTLYSGNSKNTAANFDLEYNKPDGSKHAVYMSSGEFNLDISSWNLAPSSTSYRINFNPADGYEYFIDFVENGNPELVESYVLIKVIDNTLPQNGVVHASVTSNSAGVPNANVVLSAVDGEATYSGIANSQGVCDISEVPYGEYTVTVTANGYEKLTSTVTVNDEVINLGLTLINTPPLDSMYLSESGVVSGAATLISVNPWSTSGSLQYTLPSDIKRIKSAIVIVNSYSGSGNSNNYALHSDVTLTTTATTTLGSEDLYYYGNQANDPVVYVINDHTTKQYSDYQYVYNIT
ncbi:MAG TPA: carboxypeptidase regulatory-like domain-containing protein, partial [Methanosphaera sp.]|nr:carboxypeptidase regulatory-like domain-containing protein [Methanosphaera sp.]